MNMWHVGRLIQFCVILSITSSLFLGCQKASLNGDLPEPNGRFSAATNEFPAVVMVVGPNGAGICTGTFVSERAVLTAAHCVLRSGTYTVWTSFGNYQSSNIVKLGTGAVADPNDIAFILFDEDIASREDGQIYDIGSDVRDGDTLRLVGFGCDDIVARTGAGRKRTGTNVVSNVTEYIEFETPRTSSTAAVASTTRGILGDENRAGSCFGDSGGPALASVNGKLLVVGVTHAGGYSISTIFSDYVNVATRSDNRDFIASVNQEYSLGIVGF